MYWRESEYTPSDLSGYSTKYLEDGLETLLIRFGQLLYKESEEVAAIKKELQRRSTTWYIDIFRYYERADKKRTDMLLIQLETRKRYNESIA